MFSRLTPRQLTGLERMVLFVITIYGKYFLQTPLSAAAPRIDLHFLKDLQRFVNIDEEIGQCVLKSCERHMWYLTAELVVLSFFDKDVSSEAKILMAKKLQTFEKPTVFDGGKPKFLTNIFDDTTIQLHDFVDENSWFLLEQATSFLYVTKNTPESPWS